MTYLPYYDVMTYVKEQSCPGNGLREQCDHGPARGVGRGGIVLNLPAARNRQTALV